MAELYCGYNDLLNFLPSAGVAAMTNDYGASNPEVNNTVLTSICQWASNKAYGMVSSIYSPFGNTPPAKLKEAAIQFSLWALYRRRLTPTESNPHQKELEMWEKELTAINAGDLSLDASFKRSFTPVIRSLTCSPIDTNSY